MALIQYPSPEVAFILGPQLKSGTAPQAAWFDEVEQRRGVYWAERMLGKDWSGATADTADDLSVADNHYDLVRALYQVYYRTADPKFLDLARRVADRWWESQFIGKGSDSVPGNQKPPPIYSALAGLMLRALDARPEMWGWLDQKTRGEMDVRLKPRVSDSRLYDDLRDIGYMQLYAVLLARVLPDSFNLYANGSDKPATGRVTDGATRRAQYLADAEAVAVYLERAQQPDGGWQWGIENPDDYLKSKFAETGLNAVEQPFMLGIYFESVVALHGLTQKADVKASLISQLTRGCEHLMRDTYRTRATSYYYPLSLQSWANDDRHLHTSFIHAFGYAYRATGEAKWKQYGDELWDSAFVGSDGKRGLMDATSHPKEWTMEARTAGRYLAYTATAPTPAPIPTPIPTPAPTPVQYEYVSKAWPSSTAARLALLNQMEAAGCSVGPVVGSAVFFRCPKK